MSVDRGRQKDSAEDARSGREAANQGEELQEAGGGGGEYSCSLQTHTLLSIHHNSTP